MKSIIYFSPTGNTKCLATKLSNIFESDKCETFALEKQKSFNQNSEHLIIMFSIHGFNSPRIVDNFVKNLETVNNKQASVIAVGCNMSWINDNATSRVRKLLELKGYEIVVDEILAMPLNIVMTFPEDVAKQTITSSTLKLNTIANNIIEKKHSSRKISTKSKVISFIGKGEHHAAKLFGLELHANKKCTSCEICVQNCPTKNIKFNKKSIPKFHFKCIMCMRCMYECPENAISPRISKFIPQKRKK